MGNIMNRTKWLSLLSNVIVLANFVAGVIQLHWAIIGLFIVLHAGCRIAFLGSQSVHTDTTITQTTIAPPMIRKIASIITAVILAVVIYWLGFGLRYLIARF